MSVWAPPWQPAFDFFVYTQVFISFGKINIVLVVVGGVLVAAYGVILAVRSGEFDSLGCTTVRNDSG